MIGKGVSEDVVRKAIERAKDRLQEFDELVIPNLRLFRIFKQNPQTKQAYLHDMASGSAHILFPASDDPATDSKRAKAYKLIFDEQAAIFE